MRARLASFVGRSLAAALALASSSAGAQDLADLPPPQGVGSVLVSGVGDAGPYWRGSGPYRSFMAGTFDLGVVHYRPTLSVGWGKPHHEWLGADIGSAISLSSSRLYAGLRGVVPGLSAQIGTRYEAATSQHLLPPQEEYLREELETQLTPPSRYLSVESELIATVPFPGGNLLGVLSGYAILGELEGLYVFEENLKVVVAPPWLWRARLGYLAHVGWEGSLKIGGAAEVLHVPNRDALLIRAGPLVSAELTHHLEVVGGVMIVAASPDQLGVVGADLGQLGLRYRWASGDRFAEFP
jgi:hypothetical protein